MKNNKCREHALHFNLYEKLSHNKSASSLNLTPRNNRQKKFEHRLYEIK